MYNLFLIEAYSVATIFPAALAYIEFFYFLNNGQRLLRWGTLILEAVILVLPPALLSVCDAGDSHGNGTIIFPSHRPMVYTLILLCLMAYFYCSWRKRLAPPKLEILINCLLLLGIAINIMIVLRMHDLPALLAINMPAMLTLILTLVRNRRLLIQARSELFHQQLPI